MRTLARSSFVVSALTVAACSLVACSASDLAGNAAGGLIGGGRAGEIARAAVGGALDTVEQMNRALSPEQEYYLGRAVAANAIARHGLDPDERRQDYVRKVGAAIVALSDRLPATYGGYHFAVLDTDIENGLSGPGGYVLVTRGAMLRCRSEDELAGILAHELAHVSLKHGEKIIRESPEWQQGIGTLFRVVGAAAGSSDQSLVTNMSQLLGDTAKSFAKAQSEQGYGKEFEYQADLEGTLILYSVGYDGNAVREYLEAHEHREAKSWEAHPPAADRIKALGEVTSTYGGPFDGGVGKEARAARWAAFKSGQPVPSIVPSAQPPAGPVETAPR